MERELTRRKAVQTLSVGGLTIALSGCQFSYEGSLDTSQTETPMNASLPDRHGPVRRGRFTVHIDDVEHEGFLHVTIPGSTTEEGEYREGNDSDHEKKLWGQTTFDDLEMERALLPDDTTIRDWRDDVVEGRLDAARKDVAVTLLDEDDEPLIEWQFSDAWIKEYVPPNLEVGAEDDVATESCTVAFDRMQREEV